MNMKNSNYDENGNLIDEKIIKDILKINDVVSKLSNQRMRFKTFIWQLNS